MANADIKSEEAVKPERPKEISGFKRRFVKKTGKKLVRGIAKFQTKQSLVPNTPHVSIDHFPFLQEFVDNWQDISRKKFQDFRIFHQINIDWPKGAIGKHLSFLDLAKR